MPVTRNQSAFSQGSKPNLGQPSASTESSEPSEEGASGEASRRESPDNCSICLGPFNNKSFTSSCAHSFCFVCLKQWSKVKAECPLCKQPFTSIFHSVISNDNYKIFYLPARNIPPPIDYNLYDLVGGNFRAMTVAAPSYLTLPPSLDADLTLSNFSRFQFRHRRFMGQHHHHSQHPVHGEHQYSYTGVPVNPATHINGETWPRGAEDFRREVYRRRMGPPVVVLGMENSTYRLTPAMVAASAHRMERIMPWLTRELRVLLHGHQNLRLAIGVIQPLLTQFSLDSQEFLNRVTPLLGRRSQAFMQQFIAYANSALPMQVYDRRAMYQRQDFSNLLPDDTSGSSSSDDDVVEITSISPASNNNANNINNTNNNNASSSGRESRAVGTAGSRLSSTARVGSSLLSGLLSEHGWDSPIPGPSWETLNVVDDDDDDVQIQEDPVSVSSETDDPVYRPDERNQDSDNSKAGSDLVFLKYDKPWNERSPINLTSSSEAEEPADHSRKKKKSKHKKKNKDIESKSHKPSLKIKIRRKHKARRSKDNDEDDYEVGSDSSDEDTRRRRSQSIGSGDRPSGKKHKRSKDRSKKSSRRANERTSDRELVDRLFAEAISQPNITSIFQDEPSSAAFQADSVENRPSSGKSKEKRKKKRRSSSSPSTSRAYKKHHSGHKKSSDPNRSSHSSREVAAPVHSTQEAARTMSASASMSPSVQRPGTYQPPFLPIADTVQHIPLNLWVSTWPALSVSTHPFSSGPPPTAPAMPHALNLSGPRPSGLGLPPRTISSSSSSDNASDSEQACRGNSNSHVSGSHKRTKKWVESNFLTSQAPNKEMEKKVEVGTSSSQTNKHSDVFSENGRDSFSKKSCSFSTDFLLNTEASKPSPSMHRAASSSENASYAVKQTIEVVCSSDDEPNGSGNDVLVCSSENEAGSNENSEEDAGKLNSQADETMSVDSKPDSTEKPLSSQTLAQNLSTLNSKATEVTSSRLIAYDQASSKPKRQALLPPESAGFVNTDTSIKPETGWLGSAIDLRVSSEFSNVDVGCSTAASQSIKDNPQQKTVMPSNLIAGSITTTSLAVSSAASVLTTLTSPGSVAVVTVSHTQPLVTTTPFFIFPGPQKSSAVTTSTHAGEQGYLSYPAMSNVPVSLPALLPPAVGLRIPKVPDLQSAFSFHQPVPAIIPPAAGLFQICPQNQEAALSLSQGGSGNLVPNIRPEAATSEISLFSVQAFVKASSGEGDTRKTLSQANTEAEVSLQMHPLPLQGSLPMFSELSFSTPVETSSVSSSVYPAPSANNTKGTSGSLLSSDTLNNTPHELARTEPTWPNSGQQNFTIDPLQSYSVHTESSDQPHPVLVQNESNQTDPKSKPASLLGLVPTLEKDSLACLSQPLAETSTQDICSTLDSLHPAGEETAPCSDTTAVHPFVQDTVPEQQLSDATQSDDLSQEHPDSSCSLPVSVNIDTADSEIGFSSASA